MGASGGEGYVQLFVVSEAMAGCHAGHGIGGTGGSSFYAYGSQRQRLSVSPVFVLPGQFVGASCQYQQAYHGTYGCRDGGQCAQRFPSL